MRIQHNITAMNSYRNYTANVGKMGKNLEKLSSGYKINRAGDNAAGLAISEKMRVQITGLDVAQKNAKDGISLVQTAEGALTEVHDMLNRMYELAEQSANGTYDNTTDRNQLQKEVTQLKTEINRIADSSNFNGINLLDGSLENGGTTGIEIRGNAKVSITQGVERTTSVSGMSTSLSNESTMKINMVADDGSSYTVELYNNDGVYVDQKSGRTYSAFSSALKGSIRDATGGSFEYSGSASGKFKSTTTGSGAAAIVGVSITKTKLSGTSTTTSVTVSSVKSAASASAKVTLSGVSTVQASMTLSTLKQKIFTINGQDFLLCNNGTEKELQRKLGDGITVVSGSTLSAAKGQIARMTGLTVSSASGNKLTFRVGSGKGLQLQIGDTSDSYNKLSVSIGDCHTSALGIAGLNIANQGGAAAGLDVIKNAVNKISDIRGTLGANQNRLEHTIKNLSVMQENVQDAESTIRDVDVADEMMSYTKNNILVQSAQAMLAQANQLPQGVLQLLG